MRKPASIAAAIILAGLVCFFAANPLGVMAWNSWFGLVQRADDATNYHTQKKVEDTCRAMVASYEADRLTYEQYKDSPDDEKAILGRAGQDAGEQDRGQL